MGKLFEGLVIFSKGEGSYLHIPIYKGKKRAVIFPAINVVKSQSLDLQCTIEHGGQVVVYCINYRIEDTEMSRTCMGQGKRYSYKGTHPEHANPPTSYQNPTPSNGKESGVLGG